MNIPIWLIIVVIIIVIIFCNYEYSKTTSRSRVRYKIGSENGVIYKINYHGRNIYVTDKRINDRLNDYIERKVYQNIGTKINKRIENAKKYAKQSYTSSTPLHDLYSSGVELSNCLGLMNIFGQRNVKHFYVYVPRDLKINVSIDTDNTLFICEK